MSRFSSISRPARHGKARLLLEYLESRQLLNGDPTWVDPELAPDPPPEEPTSSWDASADTWIDTATWDTSTDQAADSVLDAIPGETDTGPPPLPGVVDSPAATFAFPATVEPTQDGPQVLTTGGLTAGNEADPPEAPDIPLPVLVQGAAPGGAVVTEPDAGPQLFGLSSSLTGVGRTAVTQGDSGPLFFISTNADQPDPPAEETRRQGDRETRSQVSQSPSLPVSLSLPGQAGERLELDEGALAGAFQAQQADLWPALHSEEAGGANRTQQADLAPLQHSPLAGVGIVGTGRAEREPDATHLPPPIPAGSLSGPDGLPLQVENAPAAQTPQSGAALTPSLLPELFRYGAPLTIDAFSGPVALVGAHVPEPQLDLVENLTADLSLCLAADDPRLDRQLALGAVVVAIGGQPLILPRSRRPEPAERRARRAKH